ncbi:immunoglobulin-binding protein 1-like [Mizuhopecten yessoensis]|uniref:Immunoglobulin-binding protein 1 n=1 Tax=Mizuhopecten yessoensis TaxID=6573 RepID=A0A210Q2R2_MIZYE|nr:immunoglobulin-binding protein 1-like [Mizuhopecten yessoensis]OWF43026.1 Immunoglobulin-binding protein 1 [Mizuhopecten yessoensis]
MAEGEVGLDSGAERLPDLFENIWKAWEFLEKTQEDTKSYPVQKQAIKGLADGEKAIKMVNDLALFSGNESIQEVTTKELRYMLLPAFLGYFVQKRVTKSRLQLVRTGKAYYEDFLRQCKTYNVAKVNIHLDDDDNEETVETGMVPLRQGPPGMMKMISERESKIQMFKEQKELEAKLADLKLYIDKEHVDEEVKREYYVTLLKKWVNIASEELSGINFEIQMLELREGAQGDVQERKEEYQKKKPAAIRPFIITKDMIQKQVFGLGYPSIPTVTIEEFYEQKLKDGTFQPPGAGDSMQNIAAGPDKDNEDREKEAEEKENKIETDDPEELQKARNWDEWKDEHRKGWGNRQNMG